MGRGGSSWRRAVASRRSVSVGRPSGAGDVHRAALHGLLAWLSIELDERDETGRDATGHVVPGAHDRHVIADADPRLGGWAGQDRDERAGLDRDRPTVLGPGQRDRDRTGRD